MKQLARPWIWVTIGAIVGLASVVIVTGALTRSEPETRVASALQAGSVRDEQTTTSTVPETTTTTIPALVQPANVVLPPLPGGSIGPGSSGDVVRAYQQRFVDLHFDPGPVDGNYGTGTVYAVQALQKIMGAPRSGRIGAAEQATMQTFNYPAPLQPTGEANRTEIDVARQILTLYEGYQVRLITTTSTGSGVSYCYNSPRVNPTRRICEKANTPSGRFVFKEYRNGWDKSPLGQLYNPFYFNGGIAVHGYPTVPTTPASHGCARIPMNVAEYFHTLVHVGDPVYVFGGTPAQILSSSGIAPAPPPTAPPATAPPAVAPPVTTPPPTTPPVTTPTTTATT